MNTESRIIYESGPFYAIEVSVGFEIRKNNIWGYSTLIGSCKEKTQAIRFIDRANLYPDKF